MAILPSASAARARTSSDDSVALAERLYPEVRYPDFLHDSAAARAVHVATGTRLPVIRADWFIATASRAPLYYDLLQMPATAAELERQLRVDVQSNLQQERVVRAGFNGSGISKQNRLIERHDALHGAYWRTYDFDPIPQNLVAPGNLIGNSGTSFFDDPAPPAAPVLYYAVDDGAGFPALIQVTKQPAPAGTRLSW